MRKTITVLAISLLFPLGMFAQTNQSTSAPHDGRCEIIQLQLAARNTFRLDRFTGNIAQLISVAGGRMNWSYMTINGLPSIERPTRARFQIFTSGHAVRFTFLIDTDTGNTWVMTESGNSILWEPIR